MSETAQCLFCRIARGEIPAKVVYETPELLAFRDIGPKAPTHVLVIPRQHIATLNDVTDPGLVGRLVMAAADVARREGLSDRGYRAVINTNADGGQTVFHLHVHVLGGRHMTWPPG
jgi:histidine triad (HIT) family protein